MATRITQHDTPRKYMLAADDNVTLAKDLNVKGANFTAKQGTTVRGISFVMDNAEHIEGRLRSTHCYTN